MLGKCGTAGYRHWWLYGSSSDEGKMAGWEESERRKVSNGCGWGDLPSSSRHWWMTYIWQTAGLPPRLTWLHSYAITLVPLKAWRCPPGSFKRPTGTSLLSLSHLRCPFIIQPKSVVWAVHSLPWPGCGPMPMDSQLDRLPAAPHSWCAGLCEKMPHAYH